MNWYSVFYWVTVADGVKTFFNVFSNIFLFFTVISCIAYLIMLGIYNDNDTKEEDKPSIKYWLTSIKRIFIWVLVLMTITWAGYVFTPTKKDALIIVAGGAVGNFITKDTGASKLPSEVIERLRVKMRSEIEELQSPITKSNIDTFSSKSKEELIQILKNKNN